MSDEVPLTAAAPGSRAVVVRFEPGVAAQQLERLMSYGLDEGRTIEILRQRPVTVVLVDHTELALEDSVAQAVRVRRL